MRAITARMRAKGRQQPVGLPCQGDACGHCAPCSPLPPPCAWHVHATQPCSPNDLTAERWYAAISRPQVHSDETPGKALNLTATQSDKTYSSELATINGKPGSLYHRHKDNLSAASSEQVIASRTEWRRRRRASPPRNDPPFSSTSLASASNAPVLDVDLTLTSRRAHAPQMSYYVDITVSIEVTLAVESSAAAILTSAAAATTLLGVTVPSSPTVPTQMVVVSLVLGGNPEYCIQGYSIAIIAAVAMLAAILSCSRRIANPEPKLKTGPNLSDGLPTWLRPLSKLSFTVCFATRMKQLVLVLLLCPGAMSTTPDSGPILIHEVGMLAGHHSPATERVMREAKFHKAEAASEDPLLFKHRLQTHDAVSNKITYFEYSARRHHHVLMLNEMNISSCTLEVAGGQIQKVQLTSRDHDGLRMNVTAGTFSRTLAPVFLVLLRTAFGHVSQGRYLQGRSIARSREAGTFMASRYKNGRSRILTSHLTQMGSKRF